MKNTNIHRLAMISALTALQIILTRFLSIQTPVVRIGFAFLPLALTAMLYGVIPAMAGAVAADVMGTILFSSAAFFPGFTLTTALAAGVWGIFLYQKPRQLWRVIAASFVVEMIVSLLLNTYWLTIITGTAYMALLPVRLTQSLGMILVEIMILWNLAYRLAGAMRKNHQSISV